MKDKKNRRILLFPAVLPLLAALLLPLSSGAQEVKALARLDTSNIQIGDQVRLKLSVTLPAEYKVAWTDVKDSIADFVEIVGRSKIDTAFTPDKKQMTLGQFLTLTSFDSGYHAIPPISFKYQKPGNQAIDSALTEALLLSVQTLQVDTLKSIRDIKGPLSVPFSFREIAHWILIGLALVAGAVALIYLYRKRKKAEPLIALLKKPKRPSHEVALEELDKLRISKLWQAGQVKEYHTRLTDIVRAYIEDRFGIAAAEMTTSDITGAMAATEVSTALRGKLRQLLELADLVKFAKEMPLPDEHEQSMSDAVAFIRDTIPAVQESSTGAPAGGQEVTEPEQGAAISSPAAQETHEQNKP